MERQLFSLVYQWLVLVGRTHPRGRRRFSDTVIVAVLVWAVLHDRPIFWACQQINWPGDRPWLLQFPSPATMSRRLRTYGIHLLLEQLASFLRDQFPKHLLKIVDAKPLPVGGATKDRDARRGYAINGFAKGYKIHALFDAGGILEAWRLEPMNRGESLVGAQLLREHPGAGYVVADSNYDTRRFYQAAGRAGWQAIVRPKYPHAQSRYRLAQNPFRARGLELAANPLWPLGQVASFGQDLLELRDIVERRFAAWTNFGGGLAPLPNWVRTPHRVVVWIHAKIILAMARDIKLNRNLAA